jgi:hypothetical protein
MAHVSGTDISAIRSLFPTLIFKPMLVISQFPLNMIIILREVFGFSQFAMLIRIRDGWRRVHLFSHV